MPVIQRASSRIPQPWRNGMGVQYEITADGHLPDGWSWRLSTADITQNVPFSVLDGVTREFCVATGNGVMLTIDGVAQVCGPRSIVVFDGGSSVQATIIDGPTKDINLMLKIGTPKLHLHIQIAGDKLVGAEALVALGGGATISVDADTFQLSELDAVLNIRPSEIAILEGSVVAVR
ncbi:MAG: HutD family protein [Ilumatobacteraceae bacterium]